MIFGPRRLSQLGAALAAATVLVPIDAAGQSNEFRGELAATDERLESGELFDEYPLAGRSGDRYRLTLRSEAFDTYLLLISPDGDQHENDDFENSQQMSQIDMTLEKSGDWQIIVTSFEAGETGQYVLTVEKVDNGSGADAAPSFLSALETAVVTEHNLARTNPSEYAAALEGLLARFEGRVMRRPGKPGIATEEGPRAVREAIDFLRTASPLAPLEASPGLSAGARDHVRDQGPRGGIGHTGSDRSDSAERVSRYGTWRRALGENISYGDYGERGRDVVMQLIVDDGVPGRGHRENIFNAVYRRIGVACGPHTEYGEICVITYAGGYEEGRT